MIDGRLFLCDADIAGMVAHEGLEGSLMEVAFFTSGDFPPFKMDPLVAPLVEAMQAKRIRTLSSCEGHMSKEGTGKYPYVSFYADDAPLLGNLIKGWEVTKISESVRQLRPAKAAETQSELDELQRQLGLQTDVMKALK